MINDVPIPEYFCWLNKLNWLQLCAQLRCRILLFAVFGMVNISKKDKKEHINKDCKLIYLHVYIHQ